MTTKSGWIFGFRTDLLAFLGPIIISLVLWILALDLVPTLHLPAENFLWIQVYINLTHLYSTFFYTYTSAEKWNRIGKWMIGIPIFFFIFQIIVVNIFSPEISFLFFTHFSAWHFIKQQQAWFHIAANRGQLRTALTKSIDTFAIFSVTFGFMLVSQSAEETRGWIYPGDLIDLPNFLYRPLLVVFMLGPVTYILWHLMEVAFKRKKQNWAAHFILFCATIVWGLMRLLPLTPENQTLGYYLNQFHHATPYLILGSLHVIAESRAHKRYFPPLKPAGLWILFMITGAAILGHVESTLRAGLSIFSSLPPMLKTGGGMTTILFFNSINLTHYTLDRIVWNRNHTPDWMNALAPINDRVPND